MLFVHVTVTSIVSGDAYVLVSLLSANVNWRWTNRPVLYWNEWKSSW